MSGSYVKLTNMYTGKDPGATISRCVDRGSAGTGVVGARVRPDPAAFG